MSLMLIPGISECFTLALLLESLHLSEFNVPTYEDTFLLARLHNLTCHRVDLSNATLRFGPELSAVSLGSHASLLCQTEMNLGAYHGNLHMSLDVAPSNVGVVATPSPPDKTFPWVTACRAAAAQVEHCGVDVHVSDLHLEPPQKALDWLLQKLRAKVEDDAQRYVCDVAAPNYAALLLNKTKEAYSPLPSRVEGGLDLDEWRFFNVMQSTTLSLLWARPHTADFIAPLVTPSSLCKERRGCTTMDVNLRVGRAKDIEFAISVNAGGVNDTGSLSTLADSISVSAVGSGDLKQSTGGRWSHIYALIFDLLGKQNTSLLLNVTSASFPGSIRDLCGSLHLSLGLGLLMEVTLPDVQCDDESNIYRCHVPRVGGVTLSNLRLYSLDYDPTDAEQVFTNAIAPRVLPALQSLVDHFLLDYGTTKITERDNASSSSHSASERVYLPMVEESAWRTSPPPWALVTFVGTAFLLSSSLLLLSARRHARKPVCRRHRTSAPGSAEHVASGAEAVDGTSREHDSDHPSGEPLSLRRVLLEDGFVVASVVLCTGCFAWSNCTTAASVKVGWSVDLYAFSLLKTAQDLWGAGLHFLSVAVFIFSCVYPYVKLASILLFTVVLQRPEARVLRVIDYFGKFSFLDTFVMLIMVKGLADESVVSVSIERSFYVFLFATVTSIVIGNYATTVWRRGTTLRKHEPTPSGRCIRASTATAPATMNESGDERVPLLNTEGGVTEEMALGTTVRLVQSVFDFLWSVQWTVSIPCGAVVVLLIQCAWDQVCITYKFGGLAPLVVGETKSVTLTDFFHVDKYCGAVLVAVLFVAPCAHTLFYPRFQFLASWCAADVFIVACVASLLQLNQFVQFIIGETLEGIYTAHATLRVALLPLLAVAVINWFLACCFIFRVDVSERVKQYFRNRFQANPVVSAEEVNPGPVHGLPASRPATAPPSASATTAVAP